MINDDQLHVASGIAAGEPRPDDCRPFEIRGAYRRMKRRINGGLHGTEWYRLVWRDGQWQYVSRPLPKLDESNHRTHCTEEHGHVYAGEILAVHDRGSPIRVVQLVLTDGTLFNCDFVATKTLKIRLPNGTDLELPNPRK